MAESSRLSDQLTCEDMPALGDSDADDDDIDDDDEDTEGVESEGEDSDCDEDEGDGYEHDNVADYVDAVLNNGLNNGYDENADEFGFAEDDEMCQDDDGNHADSADIGHLIDDTVNQHSKKRKNPGKDSIAIQLFCKGDWAVTKITSKYSEVKFKLNQDIKVQVQNNRVNKAMEKLNPTSVHNVSQSTANCICKKNCNTSTLGFKDILAIRMKLYGNPNIHNETMVTNMGAEKLRICNMDVNAVNSSTKRKLQYSVSDVNDHSYQVCARYWAAVHGCSETKMSVIRQMIRGGTYQIVHGNRGRLFNHRVLKKSTYAFSFWSEFFEECCQKPTDHIRLFPVNKSFKTIYDELFVPWFHKLIRKHNPAVAEDELQWLPGLSTFKAARKNPVFNDVKKRPKHYHARCADCSELNNIRLRGFVNDAHRAEWEVTFKAHEAEARHWHNHEEARKNASRASNGRKSIVIGYDDTSCLELPKLTNRDVKNLTQSRLQIIPFNISNYTSGESAYVYTLKGRYPKGANRLCTVLYHYLRKVKFGDHPCRHARTLVLHADNFSENKNNYVFMFCTELIQRGWFDVIFLEFGPPGHTHNGTDAVHRIHNRVAGNFNSATLGEFQSHWKNSWRKDFSMPTAVINDAHLDWVKRYEPVQNRIAGFTNTSKDKKAAKAFKFAWSPKGDGVQLLFKPSVADPRWLGKDHTPESEGFSMLRYLPRGRPQIIPGNTQIMSIKHIGQLLGHQVKRQVCAFTGEADAKLSMNWIEDCVTGGAIPYNIVNEDSEQFKRDSWGPLVEIGINNRKGLFYAMKDNEDNTDENFWSLPDDIQSYVNQDIHNIMLARTQLLGTPNVRYESQSPAFARRLQSAAREQASENDPNFEGGSEVTRLVTIPGGQEGLAVIQNVVTNQQWGADFKGCKKDWHAVVAETFGEGCGGKGINVYKIGKVCVKERDAQGDDPSYFVTSGKLQPTSPRIMTYMEKCLQNKWWHDTRITHKSTQVKGWTVVCYFKALTRQGKIPGIGKVMTKLTDTHELDLFADPEQREFATIYEDDDIDVTDGSEEEIDD